MTLSTSEVASPCGSMDAVLATPELLEAILGFVSMRQLLVAGQRVCKLWKDVIDRSPQLQKHLYFRPEPAIEQKGTINAEPLSTIAALATPNPLLQDPFAYHFFPGHQKGTTWYGQRSVARLWKPELLSEIDVEWMTRRDAFMRAGASWRSMLVSQPPPQELVVVGNAHVRDNNAEVIRLGRGEPVRMGFLYDLVCYGVLRHGWGHGMAHVAWAADELRVEDDIDGPVPPSDHHNIVVQGFFPRLRRGLDGQRLNFKLKGDEPQPIILCHDYDAEAMERRFEEADAIIIRKISCW
ncbi:hypothetical protein PG984_011890 [Apiospora sp. TS-2023a]